MQLHAGVLMHPGNAVDSATHEKDVVTPNVHELLVSFLQTSIPRRHSVGPPASWEAQGNMGPASTLASATESALASPTALLELLAVLSPSAGDEHAARGVAPAIATAEDPRASQAARLIRGARTRGRAAAFAAPQNGQTASSSFTKQ
jgi:hypothetical protein